MTTELTPPGQQQSRGAALSSAGWLLAFFTISLVYHTFFLGTFSHWWFEDDPTLFAFVRTIRNPAAFFTTPETLRGLGAGGSLAPFQAVSEWIDSRVAYRGITLAHWHNVVSLAGTIFLLFHVLRRFAVPSRVAMAVCLLWLCLPSTIAVNEFLSARHYLEGLGASLLAVAVAQNIAQRVGRENARMITLLCITLGCAMLFKELFAITIPLFVAIYLSESKRNRAAIFPLLLIVLYIGYRYWIFGGGVHWGVSFLGPAEYLQYLSRLPYALAGSFGGYALVVLFAVMLVLFGRSQKALGRTLASAFVLLVSGLAVIFPVAYPVHRYWLEPGTWNRVLLLLGTGSLFAGGIFFCHLQRRYVRASIALFVGVVLGCGAGVTRNEWQRLMLQSKREGKYYISHPDRLIYSEVAPFFLDGLRIFYDIPVRHHILASERSRPPKSEIERHETIWRVVEGKFTPDPQLFAELQANARSIQ